MIKLKTPIAFVCSFALVGCTAAGFEGRIANYKANTPELSQTDVRRFVENQDRILAEFAMLAGVSLPEATGEWRPVIDAGIHYADVRCDRFMDSLFWFNRVRETSSRQIQYTGAAVSAALAVVQASVNAVGLTPLGFNFLDQTVNNFGAGLLFNLNPSNVRTIVERKQQAYLTSLSPSYTSRSTALQVIQNYAAICLPPSIETEVELAISTQEYKPNHIIPVPAAGGARPADPPADAPADPPADPPADQPDDPPADPPVNAADAADASGKPAALPEAEQVTTTPQVNAVPSPDPTG